MRRIGDGLCPEWRPACSQRPTIPKAFRPGGGHPADSLAFERIIDITAALTDSPNPRDYWYRMKRVQEIENPELARQRMKELYHEKGYPADRIEKRMRSIAIRDELTDEWKGRGIKEQKDFAILTAEISKATFGLTPTQYKDLKGLPRENLRDHMTDLELILTMLGEAATTKIPARPSAATKKGFTQRHQDTKKKDTETPPRLRGFVALCENQVVEF